MPTKYVQTGDAPAAIGPYSQGVTANGLLFTAGQIAIDPMTGAMSTGDVATQADIVMRNLQGIITAAGATWADVVKTTVFLHDLATFATVNEVYARWIGDARPARSTVQVSALPRGALVEIEAVVALKN
jgi:2-iminobutanoate/2-iminopropanoate deaminase